MNYDYEIRFTARKKGALGVRSTDAVIIKDEHPDKAVLQLYKFYEHIQVHAIIELGHEKPVYVIP